MVRKTEAKAVEGLVAATPRQLLVNWANEQDPWVKELVRCVITAGGTLSVDEIEEVYRRFLAEKRLSDESFEPVEDLSDELGGSVEEQVLLLRKLSKLEGVNALSGDYMLEFDEHLTVLFGQNGSGKTGYARVIKRAAAVRAHEPILSNAHAAGTQPTPSALFEISVDGLVQELSWNNELGLGPLQRVNVFDARSTTVHVDDELGYVFTPTELALFAHATAGLQAVQGCIEAEVAVLRKPAGSALSAFTRGTQAYALVEILGVATDIADLEKLATVPASAVDDLAQLQAEVAGLTGNTLDERCDASKRQVSDLSAVVTCLDSLVHFNSGAYEAARQARNVSLTELEEVRTQLFAPGELAASPDMAWQQFATAGEAYQTHLGLHEYPSKGDDCLYCRQPLSPQALNLLARYRVFLDESTQRQHNAASSRLDGLVLKVDAARLSQSTVVLQAMKDATKPPVWLDDALSVAVDAVAVSAETKERAVCTISDLDDRAKATRALVQVSLAEMKAYEAKLVAERTDRVKLLQQRQTDAAELKDRIELSKRLAAFKNSVADAKRAAKLAQLQTDISSRMRRSLTVASKLASEDLESPCVGGFPRREQNERNDSADRVRRSRDES